MRAMAVFSDGITTKLQSESNTDQVLRVTEQPCIPGRIPARAKTPVDWIVQKVENI